MYEVLLENYNHVGFSGSRYLVHPSEKMKEVCLVLKNMNKLPAMSVGCAKGVDEFFRTAFPSATVFRPQFSGRGGFAARSAVCVDSVRKAHGLWLCFPLGACPTGLRPSCRTRTAFNGSGSGTWASLAYAVGCCVDVLVFSKDVPAWGFKEVDAGVWLLSGDTKQLTLF